MSISAMSIFYITLHDGIDPYPAREWLVYGRDEKEVTETLLARHPSIRIDLDKGMALRFKQVEFSMETNGCVFPLDGNLE